VERVRPTPGPWLCSAVGPISRVKSGYPLTEVLCFVRKERSALERAAGACRCFAQIRHRVRGDGVCSGGRAHIPGRCRDGEVRCESGAVPQLRCPATGDEPGRPLCADRTPASEEGRFVRPPPPGLLSSADAEVFSSASKQCNRNRPWSEALRSYTSRGTLLLSPGAGARTRRSPFGHLAARGSSRRC
jgi:hypothetical protein